MLDWLRRMMYGRYGNDQLNNAFLILAFALMIIGWFVHWRLLTLLILLLLALAYLRMFSRNIAARYAENQKFLQIWQRLRWSGTTQRQKFQDRKVHRYLKCPACRANLRVPRGRGKISVTCPKCGHQFITKS